MQEQQSSDDRPAASVRTLELAVAAIAFAFGAVVAADSLRLGAGWAEDGPQAGYFPFYMGVVICGSSAWVFVRAFLRRAAAQDSFVGRRALRQIMTLLVPAIVYVAAIEFTGIYLASALFVGYFMARHGRHRALITAAVALGLPAALFMLFEVWFKTPLPKGLLEALIGVH